MTLIAELQTLLTDSAVVSDPSELLVYESDGFTIAKSRPSAVVFPTTTAQVVEIVKLLNRHDVQIVPRGSGTGLAGGCVAFDDGIIISVDTFGASAPGDLILKNYGLTVEHVTSAALRTLGRVHLLSQFHITPQRFYGRGQVPTIPLCHPQHLKPHHKLPYLRRPQ